MNEIADTSYNTDRAVDRASQDLVLYYATSTLCLHHQVQTCGTIENRD